MPGIVDFFAEAQLGDYARVRGFTRADVEFFRAATSPDYGLFVNLAGLYGYWGERIGRFALATGGHSWWPLTTALLVAMAFLGAWLRRDRAWLLACGVVGLGVSASTALPGGVGAAWWLASRVPPARCLSGAGEMERAVASHARRARGRCGRVHGASDRRTAHRSFRGDRACLRRRPCGAGPGRRLTGQDCAEHRFARHLSARLVRDGCRSQAGEQKRRRDRRLAVAPLSAVAGIRRPPGCRSRTRFLPGAAHHGAEPGIGGRPTNVVSPYDRIGAVRGGARTCALAKTIRGLGIRWALVLDAAESARTIAGLRRCGYSLVVGRAGLTALLRVPSGRNTR